MGGDGGSIPDRSDLVKTRRSDPKLDEKNALRQLWSFCTLSKEPLEAPIVACPLGKLYNKEALLSFLLNPAPFGHDGQLVASHIRSLKDVTVLSLTPNPTLLSQTVEEIESSSHVGTQESRPTALFICPISMREMNGSVKFIYRKSCGCVLSESSLKEMRKAGAGGDERTCPVTGDTDAEGIVEEWATVCPRGDELETLREEWEAKKVREKEEKRKNKEKKRKSTGEGEEVSVPKVKKVKVVLEAPKASIKTGTTIPLLSATLAAKLAEAKKVQSPAIASLYAKPGDPDHDKDGRSTWATRGCWTRYN